MIKKEGNSVPPLNNNYSKLTLWWWGAVLMSVIYVCNFITFFRKCIKLIQV